MCFSKKMKVPKADTRQKAPEPILLEPPKGVEMGDGPDDDVDVNEDATPTKGLGSLKVTKTGEGTQSSIVKDTGAAAPKKKSSNAGIKRALKR